MFLKAEDVFNLERNVEQTLKLERDPQIQHIHSGTSPLFLVVGGFWGEHDRWLRDNPFSRKDEVEIFPRKSHRH